ncbi:MAG: glucose-1-phosphate thymidylyltransferase [Flavobacteriales bacterium]|nr:glucose-1-phosphate thymidylyltransferase [Flavobacteriales bacterium]
MDIVLFDFSREDFLPLTFTRPVGDLRCGILTFAERWSTLLKADFSYKTVDYLQEKYPIKNSNNSIFINSTVFPNDELIKSICKLGKDEALVKDGIVLACNSNEKIFDVKEYKSLEYTGEIELIKYPWDLFRINSMAIEYDFELITKGRKSCELSSTNGVIGDKNRIFVEEGVQAEFCTFNTKEGSIYLGKNSQVQEGSHLRGSISLGDNATINMGSRIYGGTTIGLFSKVGGEIHNSVIWGYSNKGHDGFIGNSVIGQWCNFGADSNSSNMKNNYADVKMWSYKERKFINSGLQFCGTVMGDHSKTAINTQLNTGTVIGVFANIFTAGFPPNLVNSFSWGGAKGSDKFRLDKAFEIADLVMKRRGEILTDIERKVLAKIYEINQ